MNAGYAGLLRLGLLAALALLAGCGTVPPERGRAQPAEPADTAAPMPPADTATQIPAPVVALVAEAERHSAAGEHEAAAAKLERALRVAPRNPVLWQNLAVVHYRQDDYAEAISLAERSNSLAGDDRALRRRNWALIAAARELLGDAAGAAEARRQAAQLAPVSR